jgi:arginine/lysine/ornithine decarboxylase
MMPAPLLEALKELAAARRWRGHMPGHKGRSLPGMPQDPALIDFTELNGTGNLYLADGPIFKAETLAAAAFGAPCCAFLTGGATQGIHAALRLCARAGETVLVDRACHLSVENALAFFDLRPDRLPRRIIPRFGIADAVRPEDVAAALDLNPDIRAFILTSSTYYGVISPVSDIAEICRERGVKLVVDEAHGAHLPFLPGFGACAVGLGADISVTSAHKTLPAPGQTALLFWRDYTQKEARAAMSLTGTTSPNYAMLAAIDLCRDYMENTGRAEYARAAEAAEKIRSAVNGRGVFRCLTSEDTGFKLDPCRLAVMTGAGRRDCLRLERVFGVTPEMSDQRSVVFIMTCADSDAAMHRLSSSLQALERIGGRSGRQNLSQDMPPEAEAVMSPRSVLDRKHECVRLSEAAGRIAARPLVIYPPGVPAVAPGERIEKKHLEYLRAQGYNDSEAEVVIE